MPQQYYTQLTNYGYQIINFQTLAGTPFITNGWSIALGTGNLTPALNTTDLVNIVFDKNSANYPGITFGYEEQIGRYAQIEVSSVDIDGMIISELGLFDENNKLVAASKCKIDLTEGLSQGQFRNLKFRISINAIPADLIDITIKTPGTYATEESINTLKNELYTQYQKLEEKGKENGYAPLDSDVKVPDIHIRNNVKFCVNSGNTNENGKADLILDLGDPFYYPDKTPNPILFSDYDTGSNFGDSQNYWNWGMHGGVFGYPLGGGFYAYSWHSGPGGSNANGMQGGQTNSVSYTFETPLPAGTYKFMCAAYTANGLTYSNYNLYVTSGGVEQNIATPANLSTTEWKYTEEFTVTDTITSIRAYTPVTVGKWGIGAVHLLQIVKNEEFENNLHFKVGGDYGPLLATTATGETVIKNQLTTINADNLADGNYNVFVSNDDDAYLLSNSIYCQKNAPEMVENDIWLNTSVKPYCAKIYKNVSLESNIIASTNSSSLSVDVAKATFEGITTTTGAYIFEYDGTNWTFNSNQISLSYYGITCSGTPKADDVIIIHYTKAFNGLMNVDFDGVPIGACTITQNAISDVRTFTYNFNGWDEKVNMPNYDEEITLTASSEFTAINDGWIKNTSTESMFFIDKGCKYTPANANYKYYPVRGV